MRARRKRLSGFPLAALVAGIAPAEPTLPEWEVRAVADPRSRSLSAEARLRVAELGPDEPVLELHPGLAVRAVEIDGRSCSFGESRHGSRRLITLRHPEPLPGPHRVTLTYAGRPADPDDPRRPASGAGWLLRPAERWTPRLAGRGGEAGLQLTVELPEGYEAVADGRPEKVGGVVTFHSAGPVSGMHLLIGRWVRVAEERNGIDLAVLVPRSQRRSARSVLGAAAGSVGAFADRFGPPLHSVLTLVEHDTDLNGYAGTAFLAGGALRSGPELDRAVARAWWGLGLRDAEPGSGWSGGLVEHLTVHAKARRSDRSTAAALRARVARSYDEYTRDAPDFPLEPGSGTGGADRARVAAGRAMLVFHMLERRLGQRRFEETLRRVHGEHAGDDWTWRDWQREFSTSAGEDLDWFFEQWVRRPGAPRLELTGVTLAEADGPPRGGSTPASGPRYEVRGRLLQRGGLRRIRIPLEISYPTGSVRRTVELDSASADFRLELATRPRTLTVDPDHDLLRLPGGRLSHRFP